MKIEIAPHERMSESGSSLMRLIQNNELPTLDLLVRESIQNSSDAALEDKEAVNVAFNIEDFNPLQVNHHFEGISERLNEKYKEESAKFLEIRDSNTTGLTGPLHHSEVENNKFGNLINLVYEISKPQQKEGAGGSWGLGKTIYFRVGIGLVVYYSRVVNEDGGYESRLVACLVEDETKERTLLPSQDSGPKRGIAWWGAPKYGRQTIPVTNEEEIHKFLEDFNITPFGEKETGTSIIIPYIDEEKLMQSARAINEEEGSPKYFWLASAEEYLKVCIQRWYAPRVNNKGYSWEKRLNASVNGNVLTPDMMLPMFKAVQDLYNNCDYAKETSGNILIDKDLIHREKIHLRGVFNDTGEAGQVIFAKLTKEDLLMTPPNNQRSPYEQTNSNFNNDDFANPPLVSFIRRPGMIVNYDASGSWISNIQPPSEHEYIIALFVPNSWNRLTNDLASYSLEEYLRLGEKADHTTWNDWTVNERNPQLISKIKGHVARKINNQFVNNNEKKYESKKTSIGKSLANILLPPENFGRQPVSGKTSGEGNRGEKNSSSKSNIILEDRPEYQDGLIHMPFQLKIGKFVQKTRIELRVVSESGNITARSWESENQIGSPFPLAMNKLAIESIKIDKELREGYNSYEFEDDYLDLAEIKLTKVKSENFGVIYGVEVEKKANESCVINGTVNFQSNQENVRGSLTTTDEAGDNK